MSELIALNVRDAAASRVFLSSSDLSSIRSLYATHFAIRRFVYAISIIASPYASVDPIHGVTARSLGLLSRIGVIEPGMIGVMRPLGMAPKRDFEGPQESVFLPDFATAF
ncbi:hypothetical protein, partial [Paraburkholderia sp. NMBU_R16]|uniref:hypothetical protein n=1 Tax=Paraburkholderia sp. NMBU_R16 TaxID=2698676 RepID=UPI001C256895